MDVFWGSTFHPENQVVDTVVDSFGRWVVILVLSILRVYISLS